MHTSKYKIDGRTWIVHHNGDWSGPTELLKMSKTGDKVVKSVTLPGELLTQIGRQATIDEVISVLEQL